MCFYLIYLEDEPNLQVSKQALKSRVDEKSFNLNNPVICYDFLMFVVVEQHIVLLILFGHVVFSTFLLFTSLEIRVCEF